MRVGDADYEEHPDLHLRRTRTMMPDHNEVKLANLRRSEGRAGSGKPKDKQ